MTPQEEEYRLVPLTRGMYAKVSLCDYEEVSKYKWFAHKSRGRYYAKRNVRQSDGTQYTLPMHRAILGLEKGDPRRPDHINTHDTLDNRRSNLRLSTATTNGQNRIANRTSKCGLKGVSWHSRDRIFEASIRVNKKLIYLGRDIDPKVCHQLYREAAVKHFGEFARFE